MRTTSPFYGVSTVEWNSLVDEASSCAHVKARRNRTSYDYDWRRSSHPTDRHGRSWSRWSGRRTFNPCYVIVRDGKIAQVGAGSPDVHAGAERSALPARSSARHRTRTTTHSAC